MREPDALATMTLLPSEQGGRSGSTPPDWFGCVAITAGGNFDIRMRLRTPLVPGTTQQVDLYFLSPHLAAPHVADGQPFSLWERGIIGSGRVERWHHALAAE